MLVVIREWGWFWMSTYYSSPSNKWYLATLYCCNLCLIPTMSKPSAGRSDSMLEVALKRNEKRRKKFAQKSKGHHLGDGKSGLIREMTVREG